MEVRRYGLLGPGGIAYESVEKGTLGGHRRTKVYGRLDCPGAARALARGGPYAKFRVFFADAATAEAAGYRPCATCMRSSYTKWKAGFVAQAPGGTTRTFGTPR